MAVNRQSQRNYINFAKTMVGPLASSTLYLTEQTTVYSSKKHTIYHHHTSLRWE